MPSKKQKTTTSPVAAPAADSDNEVSNMFADDFNDASCVDSRRQKVESGDRGKTALPRAYGVLMSYKTKIITSGEKIMKKADIEALISNAEANGSTTLIETGESGEYFLLPSVELPRPAGADQYRPKERKTVYQERARVRKLHSIRVSVFVKDGEEELKPGTPVRIEGLNAQPAVHNGQETLFLNAKRVIALGPAPPADKLGQFMCDFAETPQMQSRACFTSSLAMRGYFDDTDALNTDAKREQGEVLQKRWTKYKDTAIASAAENARALPDAASADALKATADSIGELPASAFAAGEPLFPTEAYDDGHRAIFAQSGVTPWNSVVRAGQVGEADRMAVAGPLVALAAGGSRGEAAARGLRRPRLHEGRVHGPRHGGQGPLGRVDGGAGAGHRLGAQGARRGPQRPSVAADQGPGDRGAMSARPYAHTFGSLNREMAQMAGRQFFMFGRLAIVSKVLPVQRSSEGVVVQAAWPEGGTIHFDMPSTLANFPLVSKDWIVEHLCDGGSTFNGTREVDDDSAYKLPDGVTAMPSIKKHGYKELTVEQERSWNVKDTLTGITEFRVVYDGAINNVAKDKTLVESTDKGEDHLATLAGALDVELDDWLKTKCLIYAVAPRQVGPGSSA